MPVEVWERQHGSHVGAGESGPKTAAKMEYRVQ